MIGAASRHIQENGEEKSGSSSAQTTTQSKECIKRVSIWLFFYCINFYSCNSQNELFSSGDRGWFIFRSRPVERMGFSSALFALKFQPSVQQRPVQRDVFSEYIGLTHAQHPRVTPRTTREREELTKSESTKFFLCNDLTLDKDVKQGRNSSRGVDSNRSILLFNPLLSVALGRFLLFSIHLEIVFLEVHTFSDA